METKLTLFPHGTLRREVDLKTYEFPNSLQETALLVANEKMSRAMINLHNEIASVLESVREDTTLPLTIFIPDLWHYKDNLPKGEFREMWNAVGEAVSIARHLYSDENPLASNDDAIRGNKFSNPK